MSEESSKILIISNDIKNKQKHEYQTNKMLLSLQNVLTHKTPIKTVADDIQKYIHLIFFCI